MKSSLARPDKSSKMVNLTDESTLKFLDKVVDKFVTFVKEQESKIKKTAFLISNREIKGRFVFYDKRKYKFFTWASV